MGDRRGECWVLGGYLRERNYLEHLGVDKSIILKWIFKKGYVEEWTRLIWFRIGTSGGRF
jgi:hypothetical protein